MITVQYSCAACGVLNRSVQVPARMTETITDWISHVCARVVADDHSTISPNCQSLTMSNLKIPLPEGTEFVGQQIE